MNIGELRTVGREDVGCWDAVDGGRCKTSRTIKGERIGSVKTARGKSRLLKNKCKRTDRLVGRDRE